MNKHFWRSVGTAAGTLGLLAGGSLTAVGTPAGGQSGEGTNSATSSSLPRCKDGLVCAVDKNGKSCAWSGDGWDWGDKCGIVGDGKDGFSNRAVHIQNEGVGSYSYLKVFDAAGGGSTWTCIAPGSGLDLPYARWQHGKGKDKSMNHDISAHVWVDKCTPR